MNTNQIEKIELLKKSLALFNDFPKKGIEFRDLNPLYKNKELFQTLTEVALDKINALGTFDYILGVESRGFILGAVIAHQIGCGFIPVRKKGKLPGELVTVEYDLEYGSDILQIQKDLRLKNARILILDDVLATGGTLKAVIELIKQTSDVKPAFAMIMDIGIIDIKSFNLPYVCILS